MHTHTHTHTHTNKHTHTHTNKLCAGLMCQWAQQVQTLNMCKPLQYAAQLVLPERWAQMKRRVQRTHREHKGTVQRCKGQLCAVCILLHELKCCGANGCERATSSQHAAAVINIAYGGYYSHTPRGRFGNTKRTPTERN